LHFIYSAVLNTVYAVDEMFSFIFFRETLYIYLWILIYLFGIMQHFSPHRVLCSTQLMFVIDCVLLVWHVLCVHTVCDCSQRLCVRVMFCVDSGHMALFLCSMCSDIYCLVLLVMWLL